MTAPDSASRSLPSAATMALAAAGIIAAASIGVAVYRGSGEEKSASAPHGAVTPDQAVAPVAQKIAELEAKLRQDPDNAANWRMLGWSQFETGDLMRAAAAYRRAAEVEPNNAENWSSLGEALQTATQQVSPDAAAAFKRALTLDARDPRARYFIAVQKDLSDDHRGAVDDWIALLKDTPPGAPWEADLRRTITQTAERERIDVAGRMPAPSASVATAAIPGPTAQDLAGASSIPPAEQDAMVQGMVQRLADRLATNPRDADGWIRLMRSRMVLNEPDKAQAALRSGLTAFAGDSTTQARLRTAARELGVAGGG